MLSELEKSRTGAERVAAILRDRIVKGELAPGARIVERQLSAELDVSRTPIREALKLLEADGLIDITLHRGALVSEFRAQDATPLFDVIAVLEGLAARRTAEALSPALLQRFEDLHGQMGRFLEAGQSAEYFDINTVIHDLIISSCGNRNIQDAHERLIARARRGRFLAILKPDRIRQSVAEHEDLMRCFRSRNPQGAAAIWETHLRHTGETLASVLSDLERRNGG